MVMRPTMWALLLAIVAPWRLPAARAVPPAAAHGAPGRGLRAAGGGGGGGGVFYSLDPRRTGPAESTGDYEIAFLDALTRGMHGLLGKALHTNLPALLHPSASEAVLGLDVGHLDLGSMHSA
jgi:hypothetical protein